MAVFQMALLFFLEYFKPKIIAAIKNTKQRIVPELKGKPIVFTKNNSKVEIKLMDQITQQVTALDSTYNQLTQKFQEFKDFYLPKSGLSISCLR